MATKIVAALGDYICIENMEEGALDGFKKEVIKLIQEVKQLNKDLNMESNKLSSYIRPVVTLLWTLSMLYCIITKIPIGEWEKTLYITIITFYFAEKAALKKPGG